MGKPLDLIGQTFGRLTVTRHARKRPSISGRVWEVRCSCGEIRYLTTGKLRSGDSVSCGCQRRERMVAFAKSRRIFVKNGRKACSTCKKSLPVTMFHKCHRSCSGLGSQCKDCHGSWALSKKYGLAIEEARRLRNTWKDAQCAVCATTDSIHIDHNHATGQIRGFLCGNCNRAVGLLQDNPVYVSNLVAYLQHYHGNKTV